MPNPNVQRQVLLCNAVEWSSENLQVWFGSIKVPSDEGPGDFISEPLKDGDGEAFCLAITQEIHSIFDNIPLDDFLTHKRVGMSICANRATPRLISSID